MMNVRFHHGGVDPQLRAVLQAQIDRRLNDRVIDRLHRRGREPVERAVERVVFRDHLARELREIPQRIAVGDPFAQFPIVPVLYAHQDQRSQDLRGGHALPSGGRFLEAPRQVAPHPVDEGRVRVEEGRDGLQGGLELNPLLAERQIGEADLGIGRTTHSLVAR